MESPTRNIPHLQPVSPERVNRMPGSPTLSTNGDPFVASPGANSVQGKVAQFNNLSKEASQKRKDNEAALRRAVLGREEAENETRRLKEENAALRQKLEDARARDQRVAKKFESYTEEKRKLVEHQHKVQKISDEEIRRSRKEAFKFSSALVKAQEDLQKARNHMEELNDQANIERSRGKKFQQEAFDAKLALSDVEDELEAIKTELKTVIDERNALRTNLNEEQVARVAAEGRIPLPRSTTDDEFSSPKKSKQRRVSRRVSSRRESLKENMDPAIRNSNDIFDIMWAAEEGDEFAVAKRNLWVEEKRRQEAEIMIKYLKAEYEIKPKACNCNKHAADATKVEGVQDVLMAEPESPLDLEVVSAPANIEESVVMMNEDTVVHHEQAEMLQDDGFMSPSIQSEPPPFIVHEDVDDITPTSIEPTAGDALAPVVPSVSPSTLALEVDADKENLQASLRSRLSYSRISNSGINTADTSILSIKSEDVDDSDRSTSYVLTPRPPPNAIVPSRESTPMTEKLDKSFAKSLERVAENPVQRRPTPVTEISLHSAPTPVLPTPIALKPAVTPVFHSNTTTRSVPLKDDSEEQSSAKNYPFSPGATMTREQALEAIKQRRRRAKSIHDGTSGKALNELLRRDVSSKSAPA